jgi:hypothetical protein
MHALLSDPSTAAQAKAAVTYDMIVATLVTLSLTGNPIDQLNVGIISPCAWNKSSTNA